MKMVPLLSGGNIHGNKVHCWGKIKGGIHQIADELTAPPSLAAVHRFFFPLLFKKKMELSLNFTFLFA